MAFVFKLFLVYFFIQNFDPGASITVPFTSLTSKLPNTFSTTLDKNADAAKNVPNPSTLTAVNIDFNKGTKSTIEFNGGSKSSIIESKSPSSTSNSISAPCSVGTFQDGKIASSIPQTSTSAKQSIPVSPQKPFSQSFFVSNPQAISSQISALTENSSYLLPSSCNNAGSNLPSSTGAGLSQPASNILQFSSSSSPQVELSLSSQKTCQNPQIQQQSLDSNNYLSQIQLQSFASQQQNSAQKQITSPITSVNNQNSVSTSLCENKPSFSVTSTSANLSELQNEQTPDIKLKSNLYIPNSVSGISQDIQLTQCYTKGDMPNLSIDIVNQNNYNGLTQNLQQNNKNKNLNLLNLNTINNVKKSQDNVNVNSVCSQQNEANKITGLQNQQPNFVNNVLNSGKIVLNSLNSNTAPCKPQEANNQENSQSILQNSNNIFNSISSFNNIPTISSSFPYTSKTLESNKDSSTLNSCAFAPNAQTIIAQPQFSSPNIISQDPNNIQSTCFNGFNSLSPSINFQIQSSDNPLQNSNLQFASQLNTANSNNNFNNASPFKIFNCNDNNVVTETELNALLNQNKQIVGQALQNNQQTPFNIITNAQNPISFPNFSNVANINSKPCDTPSFQVTDNNLPNPGNVISISQSCLDKNNPQIILNSQTSPNNIQIIDFNTLASLSNAQDTSQAQFIARNIEQSQNNPALIPLSNDCNTYNKDFKDITTTSGAINNDINNCNLNEFNNPSISLTRIPNLVNDNFQNILPSQQNSSPNFYIPTTFNSASQPELIATPECYTPVNSFNNNPRVLTLSPNFTFFGNLDNSLLSTPQVSDDISCVGPQNSAKEQIPSRTTTLTISPNFSYFSDISPIISNTAVNLDSSCNDQILNNVEISINKDNQVIQPTIAQLSSSVISDGSPQYQVIQPTITQISTPICQYPAVQPTISQISSPVITNDSPQYQNAILEGMSSLLNHYRSTNQAIQTCNTPPEISVEIITEPKCPTQPVQAIEIPNSLASINQNDVIITPYNEIASFNQFSNTPLDFSVFPYASIAAPVIELATTDPSLFYSSSQLYPSSSLNSINPLISSPDANCGNFLPVLPPPPPVPPLFIDSSKKSRPYDSVLKLLLLTELLDNDGCNNLNSLLPLLAVYNI